MSATRFTRSDRSVGRPIGDEQDPRYVKMMLGNVRVQIRVKYVLMDAHDVCVRDGFSKEKRRLCDVSNVGIENMKEERCQKGISSLVLGII